MIYTSLSEPTVTYRHTAIRSPLLLRVESIWPAGSFRLLEYLDRRPVIEADGPQDQVRTMFTYVCDSLHRYVGLGAKCLVGGFSLREYPGLYEIDIRRDLYRLLLVENSIGSHRTLMFGNHDPQRVLADLQETSARIREVYQIHYGLN